MFYRFLVALKAMVVNSNSSWKAKQVSDFFVVALKAKVANSNS